MDPNKIYLVQTDTTAGFLSRNVCRLNKIKKRPSNRPVLKEVDCLNTLKKFVRVPKKHRKKVRNAHKTTFIFPNGESCRVVKDERHLEFLRKFKWMYSTSANLHGEHFNETWAKDAADVIMENKRGFFEGEASKIFKISKTNIKRIR